MLPQHLAKGLLQCQPKSSTIHRAKQEKEFILAYSSTKGTGSGHEKSPTHTRKSDESLKSRGIGKVRSENSFPRVKLMTVEKHGKLDPIPVIQVLTFVVQSTGQTDPSVFEPLVPRAARREMDPKSPSFCIEALTNYNSVSVLRLALNPLIMIPSMPTLNFHTQIN